MALADNILAYWQFAEASGNALDASGNGQTLTNNGSVPYGTFDGNYGVSLDGTDDYFSRSSIASIAFPYTINIWLNEQTRHSNADPAQASLLWNFTDSGSDFAEVSSNNGVLYYAGTGASSWHSTSYTLPLATLTMLTFSMTATTFSLYENGDTTAKFSTSTEVPAALATAFHLGAWQNGTQGLFKGYIYKLGIWGRDLTATERSGLYASGPNLAYPFSTGGRRLLLGVGT